ncbi:hypothetical protein CYMTET_44923, partial [Cymbomonas tetramitiformis]
MVEMVRVLVGEGAEVDAEDVEGRTALTVALAFGQEAAARALLEVGAGVNAGTGWRPLHAAAERGTVEMVRELAGKGAEVDAEDGEGRTALTVALAFGQEAAARALLEAGAGVNAGTGRRPLHAAAEKGMVEMLIELAGKGVEVDAEDREGRTALTVALAFGQEGAARALLEAGAGVNAGTGQRPLHAAAERGMVEMVRELLGKGVEVDAEDGEGRTALTVALAFGQEAAARALLEAGAGVNAGTGRRLPLMAWGCISRWRLQGDEGEAVQVLEQVQKALSEGDSAGRAPLTVLANEVSEMLGSREILMKQSKLVEMAEEWLQTRMEADVEAALQDLLRDVAGGEMVDASRAAGAAPEGRVGQLREATTLEEAIRAQAVPHALRSALRRPPVRRFRIYAMFLEHYVEREAAKARVTVKGYDSEVMRREGPVYAQRLALQMVAEGVSKVPLRSDSELFHRKSVWDPFLRDGGELREAAQKAAPVRCTGGVLSFIHKTVQEFLCAAGLRDALHRILRELAVPLEALMQQLEPNLGPAVVASEEARVRQGYQTVRWAAGTGASRRADGEQARGWPHELSGDAGSIAGGTQEVDQMTVAKALRRAGTGLVESEWAQVDLRQESVVRDFLADCVLDEPEFTEEVQFLAAWAELHCKGGRLAGTGGVDGGGLLGNVRAVLGGALPKRSGGALLHTAAADGSHFTVSVLLKLLRGGRLDEALLEAVDDEDRTPLFCAAQRGHAQVVAALRAAGAKHDARSKLQPSVRLVAVVPFTKIPQTEFGQAVRAAQPAVHVERGLVLIGGKEFILEHGIVGAPAAAPFEGSWRFEGVSLAGITSETSGADFNHFAQEGRTPTHVAAR